jgi:N-acetylglucosaminyl-diphospho-decaprenol L-rhamnosyltransferase
VLLNSDTLVRPGAISELLEGASQYPQAGLIAPRLEWSDRTPQISCFRDHGPIAELIHGSQTGPLACLLRVWQVPVAVSDRPMRCDWVSFACVLIRHEVLERVGLLDEGYFMYFEDADYCRRARRAGFEVLYWPQSRVVHLRGGTSPVKRLSRQRRRRPAYYYLSRSRYLAKFYGRPGLWGANLLWLTGRTIALARELLGNKQPHTCDGEERDLWTGAWRPLAR